jgi:sugar lactone lactonase YvrE
MAKLLLFILVWGSFLSCAGQVPNFKLTKTIGTPVYDPMDVVVDKAGFIYLLDWPGINKLAPNGELVQSIVLETNKSGGFGLGVDDAGNMYVCNYSYGHVQKYNPAGKLLLEFGSVGSGQGQFQYANSLTVDAAGNIYVADTDNNRLQKFDTNGKFLFEYKATSSNKLDHPMDVALDTSGAIYLFDKSLMITKLSATGALLQTIPLGPVTTDEGTSIAVDAAGDFYLSTFRGGGVAKYSKAGVALRGLEAGYDWSESTHTPIALDAAGNVYATTFSHGGQSRLLKFDANGKQVGRWGNLTSFAPATQDAAGNYYYINQREQQLYKYSPTHQLLAKFPAVFDVAALAVDVAGNIYQLAWSSPISITKLGPDGRLLATYSKWSSNISYNSAGLSLAVDAAGTMYVPDYYNGSIRRINAQGDLLPSLGTRGTGAGQLFLPLAVAIDAHGFLYVADNVGQRVQRFTPSGQFLQEFGERYNAQSNTVGSVDMAVDGSGNIYVHNIFTAGLQVYSSASGTHTILPDIVNGALSIDRQASRLMVVSGDVIRFYSGNSLHPQNLITGNVFEDQNGNCVRDATDPALPSITVVAQPGDYYGLSDVNGNYTIAVDTGAYTVQQVLPRNEVGRTITPTCASAPAPTPPFTGYGNVAHGPDFGNQVSTQPYLSVSVAVNRRRRCARNTTTVAYSNTGFAPAPNAQVVVALPPHVVLVAASAPHTQDAQGNYVFALGTLAPYQQGTLTITDSVACGDPSIRGLTLCTKAWIAPVNAYPASALWNKASMVISSTLEAGNKVRFVLRNQGRGATTDSLALRLYQDAQLALRHTYALAAGDSLVLRVPATRPVVRLEADQPADHPWQAQTSATVEVPALRLSAAPSSAMVAQPPNGGNPVVAEDCQPVVDSFDPNDKQVLPAGVTAQHYTPSRGALTYQVRFQNTGSAPAYYVQVVDTLSADLDLRTLRVGAASHPFQLSVSGKGRPVLTFTFNGLTLPSAAQDALGSQGFVYFSIEPKASLVPKTLIANYADIFFDYNTPVRTNTTSSRIYDMPTEVEPAVQLAYTDVVASPSISRFVPAQGKAGTLVTITGQRFAAAAATNQVFFDGVMAPVLTATPTTLTVRVPAGAAAGKIKVQTPNGVATSGSDFTAFLPPTLVTITPGEGVPGALITLTGTNFSTDSRQDTVTFSGVAAVVRQASATALTVEVPADVPSGRIVVQTLGGQVASATPFRVWYPPTVAGFAPAKARAGGVLTITGTNFAETAARNVVTLGGAQAVVLMATSTQLQVQVPAGAATGALVVTTPGGQAAAANLFAFVPAPVITNFTPLEGSVGTLLTINGAHFNADSQADTVYINGVAAAVLSTSATQAVVRVPKGVHTGPLAIAGAGGVGRSSQSFLVQDLTPSQALALYPNPAHEVVTVDWQHADFLVQAVRLYNAVGKLVTEADVSGASQPLTTLSLAAAPGLYVLVIQTERGPVVKRLVIH